MSQDLRNSERFIRAYNSISKELERIVEVSKYMPFYRLVDMAKKKSGIVMAYKDDLKELSHLRNAIVHDKDFPETAIAEPHLKIVELVEKIARELEKPKKLIPFFEKQVKTFQKDESILEALHTIKTKEFTQFPVYDGQKFLGLVTDHGITRWLASFYRENEIVIPGRLNDVLNFERNKKNYVFMNREQNIYDAKEIYTKHYSLYSTRLEAILITENGSSTMPLLGIATPFDLIKINGSIL